MTLEQGLQKLSDHSGGQGKAEVAMLGGGIFQRMSTWEATYQYKPGTRILRRTGDTPSEAVEKVLKVIEGWG